MTGLVDAARALVSEECLVEKCDKNGCSVSLKDVPQPHVVIDLDRPNSLVRQNQIRCDYLFVADKYGSGGWVVPMEFKNSDMRVSKVVKQLQAGARAAEKLASGRSGISFRPVAVVRGFHSRQRKELKRESNEVSFRGCRERVHVLVCDDLLTEALRE